MRALLALLSVALAGGVVAPAEAIAAPPPGATPPSELRILGADFPRAFFFRAAESQAANPRTTFEAWDADFSRLMGIMGKALDEEVLGREARNPEFFTRFKRAHPDRVVLLHLNGNARDPRYHAENFFPGHWIYRSATAIVADVPAEAGETTVRVRDASDFRVNTGRYLNANDDIALFGVTAEGKHDWNHCEQVQLLAVDAKANTIRVRRGCYGTRPLAFKAGAARADHIGFLFQQFNLLPWLSALDNVTLPCTFSPRRRERAGNSPRAEAERLLSHLDLGPDTWHGPAGELSVGQQQRVAAARALIGRPEILIADEPTSALDAERQQIFIDLLLQESVSVGATLVFVSHDRRLAGHFDRIVALDDINRVTPEPAT